jgi:hypothetical protein
VHITNNLETIGKSIGLKNQLKRFCYLRNLNPGCTLFWLKFKERPVQAACCNICKQFPDVSVERKNSPGM